MAPPHSYGSKMSSEEYKSLCRSYWHGWDKFNCTQKERQIIRDSRATTYYEFLLEHIDMAKKELATEKTHQFYSPEPFYDSFSKPHYHGDHMNAAHRRASDMHYTFLEFVDDMNHNERPLPNMEFVASKELVERTWNLINTLAKKESWAWPLVVCLSPTFYTSNWHFLRIMPFFRNVLVAFAANNLTEKDFMKAQKEIHELVHA